jgi:hypothetical protein
VGAATACVDKNAKEDFSSLGNVYDESQLTDTDEESGSKQNLITQPNNNPIPIIYVSDSHKKRREFNDYLQQLFDRAKKQISKVLFKTYVQPIIELTTTQKFECDALKVTCCLC